MAFDVYVGTMTRYYRHEWENVTQKWAREQGMKYHKVSPGSNKAQPPAAASMIQGAVRNWCAGLTKALQPHGVGPLQWDEGENQPYFTDRPGWEGYSALLLWTAYSEHSDMVPPTELPESWADDPAFIRSTSPEFKSMYNSILLPMLWLPVEFTLIFSSPTLVSEEPARIGSTFSLRDQLDQVHSKTSARLKNLKAAEENRGDAGRENKPARLATEAEFSLDVFRNLAAKACEHRLPILLDF